jgi:hypothetical protein
MAGKATGKRIAVAIVGLAALGGVFAAGAHELLSARLAVAGANSAWPAGACQSVNVYDHEIGADRAELICWTSDFALSIPEPGGR